VRPVPGTGWGEYRTPIVGICDGDTGKVSIIEECVPNSITGRGCIGSNGLQTYQPRITTQDCTPIIYGSRWSPQTVSGCVDGRSTISETCIVTEDPTGVNGCVALDGLVYRLYNVGDVRTWEVECIPLTPLVPPGVWLSNGVSTPSYTGIYNMGNDDCIVDELPPLTGQVPGWSIGGSPSTSNTSPFNLLSEGYRVMDMVCSAPQRCTNLSSSITINGQTCIDTIPPEPIPSDVNPIICGAIHPSVITPCRYRPLSSISFGVGTAIDVMANSLFLFIQGGRTIIPIQTPPLTSNPQVKRLFDWNNSPTAPLDDVSLCYVDPSTDTRDGCTNQQVSFNTGMMSVLGVKSVETDGSGMTTSILTNLPGTYTGWMRTDNTSSFLYTQAVSVPSGFGSLSIDAQVFRIELLSTLDPTPVSGYPITCKGTIRVNVKDMNGDSIRVPSINTVVDPSVDEWISMDDIDMLLFSLDTEMCTRSLRGLGNCNLLYDVIPTPPDTQIYCQAPLLTV
jgi:hypothetical protein